MLLYLFCFLTAASLLALDQWAKFWVEGHMALEEIRPLLPPVLELHAVHNYGAAWSLFAGARWVLVGITAAMMLVVALALCLRLVRHPMGVFSAFLILSGGVGNLLDRIFQGYVVDMLRFPFWTSYPTFNVADVCVVSGCVLWLLYVFFVKEDLGGGKKEKAGQEAMETLTDTLSEQDPRPTSGGWDLGEDSENVQNVQNVQKAQNADTKDSTRQESVPVPEGNGIQKDAEGVRRADSTWKSAVLVRLTDSAWRNGGLDREAGRSGEAQTPDSSWNTAESSQTADSRRDAGPDGGKTPKREETSLPPIPPVLLSSAQEEEAPLPEPPRVIDPAILGSSPWKAMYAEEDEAEARAEAKSADRKEGAWDSAETFFGGTPFRKSDRNGSVWP